MFQTCAAVVREPNTPFQIEQVLVDDPRPNELLVRMTAAGLCHTDLLGHAGHLPFPLPAVFGHEGAGVVEMVGDGVTTVKPGDRVLLSFTSCGDCRHCRSGQPAVCQEWLPRNLFAGNRPDGTSTLQSADGGPMHGHFFGQSSFSMLALADERNVVRVDPDAPLEVLAPLGCGVQTGVGTVYNVLRPYPGATLAVVGAGAVGLSAIMAAALSPATTIIAVDRTPERLALATELGATATVDVGRTPLAEGLAEITHGRGVDLALDTTGDVATIATTVANLAVGGTLAFVGAPPPGTGPTIDVQFMLPGRSVVGVTEGSVDPRQFVPILVELHRQGRLPVDKLVKTYRFQDIQTAVEDVHAGRTVKPVILFDGA